MNTQIKKDLHLHIHLNNACLHPFENYLDKIKKTINNLKSLLRTPKTVLKLSNAQFSNTDQEKT